MNFLDEIKIKWKAARWGEDFKEAENLIKEGSNKEALEILNNILKIESDPGVRFPAFSYKGCALYSLGRYDETIENNNEALKIFPDCTPVLEQKGDALKCLGKYQEAMELCIEVLKIEPNNIHVLMNKGLTLYKLGKYQEAINAQDKIIEIEPWNIKALANKEFLLNFLEEKKDDKYKNDNSIVKIIKIRVPDKIDMWIVGEQGRDENWVIYLIDPGSKYKEIIKKEMTTKAFAIFSRETLKTPFPYENASV